MRLDWPTLGWPRCCGNFAVVAKSAAQRTSGGSRLEVNPKKVGSAESADCRKVNKTPERIWNICITKNVAIPACSIKALVCYKGQLKT